MGKQFFYGIIIELIHLIVLSLNLINKDDLASKCYLYQDSALQKLD